MGNDLTREQLICPQNNDCWRKEEPCYRAHSFATDPAELTQCRWFGCKKPFEVLVIGDSVKRAAGYCYEHRDKGPYKASVVGVYPWINVPENRQSPYTKLLPELCSQEKNCGCGKVHVFIRTTSGPVPLDPGRYYCIHEGCTTEPMAIYQIVRKKMDKPMLRALCETHAPKDEAGYVCVWPLFRFVAKTYGGTGYVGGGSWTSSSCKHWRSKMKVGDHKILVSGRHSRPSSYSDYPAYGIFLDTAWDNDNHARTSPLLNLPKAVAEAVDTTGQKALILNWVDMSDYPIEVLKPVIKWCAKLLAAGEEVEVGCLGGHGRTGTFLSCLLVEVEGLTPEEAIKQVRSRHCNKAVESPKQVKLVYEYAGVPVPKETPKASKGSSWSKIWPPFGGGKDKDKDTGKQLTYSVSTETVEKDPVDPSTGSKPKSALTCKDEEASDPILLTVLREVLPKKLRCPFCLKRWKRAKWSFPSPLTSAEVLRCPSCKELVVWAPLPDATGEVRKCPYSDCAKVMLGKYYVLDTEDSIECILCEGCGRVVRMPTDVSDLPPEKDGDDDAEEPTNWEEWEKYGMYGL